MTELSKIMIQKIYKNSNIILVGIDDSPAPNGIKFICNNIWVAISAITRHKNFGTISPIF